MHTAAQVRDDGDGMELAQVLTNDGGGAASGAVEDAEATGDVTPGGGNGIGAGGGGGGGVLPDELDGGDAGTGVDGDGAGPGGGGLHRGLVGSEAHKPGVSEEARPEAPS